jgi:aspartate-semialdehyde dehydrogenase
MSLPEDSLRVAIAGAASLRGQDLKSWIDESGFPAGEIRLLDEELLAGTLTEVAGEATLIQPIDQDSFEKLRFAFFAGSRAFAKLHAHSAARAGATVIDLTGELSGDARSRRWIPRLDGVLTPPWSAGVALHGGAVLLAPSAPAIIACSLAAVAAEVSARRVAITFFSPVSERGKEGVEELSEQMVKLLSLKAIPQDVFDCQVAFNMLDRWGGDSAEKLADWEHRINQEVSEYLSGRVPPPAVSLVHAPVFYGHTFSVFLEFAAPVDPAAFASRLTAAGFHLAAPNDPGPSNVGIAGESKAAVSALRPDGSIANAYWLWGAADNLRLPVSNALHIAEKILVS